MGDTAINIGIFLFDEVEELDAVGPWEVLSYWTRWFAEDGYRVLTFSPDGNQVTCSKGLRIVPDLSISQLPPLGVLVYPGGQGTRAHLKDPQRLAWVQQQRQQVALMTSVCTGSLVYAAAGLLAHRPATTHWAQMDHLGRLDPTIELRPHARYVDDGDVVTAAGVSAGIDMALHLVRRLASPERARRVRQGIQYIPEPPV